MNHRNNYNDGYYNNLCSDFQNLSLNTGGNSKKGKAKRKKNVKVYLRPSVNPNHEIIDKLEIKPVWYRNLHPTADAYQRIKNIITNNTLKIENIVEVNNAVLKKLYTKKRKQKMKEFKGKVEERWLFHGTSKANVDGICTYNFDWRLYGNNCGHKYGKGVNFSSNAMYAGYYSDKMSYHKVMIVAKVLIANSCKGNQNMTYPPVGYDASHKKDGIVVVKYDDNEFYPAYKLYYHIENEE